MVLTIDEGSVSSTSPSTGQKLTAASYLALQTAQYFATGADAGGGPEVKVFAASPDHALKLDFFAFDPGFRNGFSVAAGDLDGDAKAEIVVGAGNGGGPAVAVFHGGDFREVQSFFAFDPGFRGGVSVAVGNFAGTGPAIVASRQAVVTAPPGSFFASVDSFLATVRIVTPPSSRRTASAPRSAASARRRTSSRTAGPCA